MLKLDEGWATVGLVASLVVVSAWGVEAPGWAPGLWTASVAGLIGVLAGLALSKSRFTGFVATLFATVYGAFWVGFLICNSELQGDWHLRTLELLIRLNNFIYYALNGGTSRDILPFPVFVGLVFWYIGVAAAWAVFRRGTVWPAILPGGIVLLINSYYYIGQELELYLGAYLVLALLLLARMNLLDQEHEWRGARVAYTPDTRFEFLRAGLVAAVAIVAFAWLGQRVTVASASPQAATAWSQVNGAWATVRENFERLFNSVRNPGLVAEDFYGNSLALGGATSLTNREILTVVLDPIVPPRETGPSAELPPEDLLLPDVPRYYWRAYAYQEYVAGRWELGDGLEIREQTPTRGALRLPPYRLREDVSATFTSYLNATSRLYVLPQPRLVDRAVSFETYLSADGTVDPVAVRAQTMLTGDDRRYRIVASVSVADKESLRGAGQDYPDWVSAYFLQVPDTITPRTRALARQIVESAGATTPFDQAQAITDWLRDNITYDLGIAAPPQGAEPLDYFLFESRRGYCNYYASAMVILLRSLGTPARLAVGFAQGELDTTTRAYLVRERNAHAWPEVFFPGYGWIEFEPTTSEPPLVRPDRPTPTSVEFESLTPVAPPTPALDDEPTPPPDEGPAEAAPSLTIDLTEVGRWARTLLTGLGVLAVAGGVTLGLLVRANLLGLESLGRPGRQILRWLRRAVPSAVTQAYLELERAAHWLGLRLPDHLTPHERAQELTSALPEARPAVDTITAQYVAEQYSPYPEIANGRLALGAWQGLRNLVWSQGLQRAVHRWTRRWLSLDGQPLLRRPRPQPETPDRWDELQKRLQK